MYVRWCCDYALLMFFGLFFARRIQVGKGASLTLTTQRITSTAKEKVQIRSKAKALNHRKKTFLRASDKHGNVGDSLFKAEE